jgi:tetratricopeptide (TPR) repeat protein
MELVTEDGSVLHLMANPETNKLTMVLFPREVSIEEADPEGEAERGKAILDIYQCALSEETLKRLHKCLQNNKPFRCIATDFRVISSADRVSLLFKKDYAPGHHRAALTLNSSKTFRLAVSDSISLFQGIDIASAPYAGIKVSCPADFQQHTLAAIQNAMADQDVAPMTPAEFWFEGGIYLFECPRELFEGNSMLVAARCFRLALESWTPESSCDLDDIRCNLASTLCAIEENEGAIEVLEAVVDREGRFWAIHANCLQSLGRHEEAVLSYERAIHQEPTFWLPHVRILQSLREMGSERYEFYLQLALARFRNEPWVAFYWAEYLFKQNRLDELEGADWMDNLESKQQARLAYDPVEGQECILRARQFKMAGKAQAALLRFLDTQEQVDERAAEKAFADALASLRPLDVRSVSCDPAKVLLAIASSLGKVEELSRIQSAICPDCIAAGTGLFGPPKAYEARAWLIKGDATRAVECSEAAISTDDANIFALESLMMAFDTLDEFERATVAARRIEAAMPGYPAIKRHIGRLFLQTGELAKARAYLERWLESCPDDLVMMDQLVCLELLDHQFEQAEQTFQDANRLISANVVKFEDIEEHGQEATPLSHWRQNAFEALIAFARSHDLHPEYGRLVLSRMEQTGAFGVLFAKLKPTALDVAGLFEQIVNAPSHLDVLELKRNFALHQKGDFSGLSAQLGQKVTGWDNLPDAARRSLLEAARSINRGESIDYAPSVVAAAKSLEVALKGLVFDGFRDWFVQDQRYDPAIGQAKEPKYEKVMRLRDFIVKNAFLELGSMLLALRLGTGKTARECLLLQSFVEFVSANGLEEVLSVKFIDEADAIAKLRNEAAHAGNITRTHANELLDKVLCSLSAFGSNATEACA